MKVVQVTLLTIFCFLFAVAEAQPTNFAKVDSFAISIGKADGLTIPQLAHALTDPFTEPTLKTRAIYTWMAYHIAYDCPAYHTATKRKADPKDVFRMRKAVCEGYANLFAELCEQAKLMCLTIDGFARNGTETFEEELKEPNHTWNAVRINGEWKLVDVTWASGYTDKWVKNFTQSFSGTYLEATDDDLCRSYEWPRVLQKNRSIILT